MVFDFSSCLVVLVSNGRSDEPLSLNEVTTNPAVLAVPLSTEKFIATHGRSGDRGLTGYSLSIVPEHCHRVRPRSSEFV